MDLEHLPKVSLHEHLDGGLRAETIIEIAERDGTALPHTTPDELRDWFHASCSGGSLEDYLKTFELTLAVMQKRDDLIRIAYEHVLDLALDGIVYAEVRWAPEQHTDGGMTMAEAIHAVQLGFEKALEELGRTGVSMEVKQIICAMRQNNLSLEVARLALQFRDSGVVGFDLAGPEFGYLADIHEPALRLLAENHFPVTLHAGEAAGIVSIRSAIFQRALRLGHGTKLAEDLDLDTDIDGEPTVAMGSTAEWVRDREIALEICPSSNLQTGASPWGPTIQDHPFDVFYRLGMRVTVSCDNRLMSATTLSRELGILAEAFGYTLGDILEFQVNAAMASFQPLEDRFELIERLEDAFESLL